MVKKILNMIREGIRNRAVRVQEAEVGPTDPFSVVSGTPDDLRSLVFGPQRKLRNQVIGFPPLADLKNEAASGEELDAYAYIVRDIAAELDLGFGTAYSNDKKIMALLRKSHHRDNLFNIFR